jgi:hypothetical protein
MRITPSHPTLPFSVSQCLRGWAFGLPSPIPGMTRDHGDVGDFSAYPILSSQDLKDLPHAIRQIPVWHRPWLCSITQVACPDFSAPPQFALASSQEP